MVPKIFLKKGEGKLASQYHGQTLFSLKRKEKIKNENQKLSEKTQQKTTKSSSEEAF